MKPLIDVNRLNYLIQKGQDSYSDGREEFEYELLCDLMRRLKVRIHSTWGKPRPASRKRYPKAREWNSTHEWQIQVVSNYSWEKDELEDDEEEPLDAGTYIQDKSASMKEILRRWRQLERRRGNPHEKWSIKLVRKIQPKLP